MATELAYLIDPFRFEFQAEVLTKTVLPDGRRSVVLPTTYFYPTGGGQEHDTGMLGDARVLDVLIDDAGTVTHVIDRDIDGRNVPARIDGIRRMAFMQHHSGQHLLSQAIAESLNLETLSAKISIESPSTIDVPATDQVEADFARAETLANSIIYQDRPIKSYIIPEAALHTVPFRRAPKVHGAIRVVEIEGFDYSACGGTHCNTTGMIGVLKVLRLERRGDNMRVHFAAGGRAVEYFQSFTTIVNRVANFLSTSPESIVGTLERQEQTMRAQAKELEELRVERVAFEARQLVASAEGLDAVRLVTASFRDRPPQEVRILAAQFQDEPGVVAVLATYDGSRVTLTVTCAPETGVSASELVRRQLADIGGRGGGDTRLAQGGGALSEDRFRTLFANTKEYIRAIRK